MHVATTLKTVRSVILDEVKSTSQGGARKVCSPQSVCITVPANRTPYLWVLGVPLPRSQRFNRSRLLRSVVDYFFPSYVPGGTFAWF